MAEKLVIDVNEDQKATLVKLFEMLQLQFEVIPDEEADSSTPNKDDFNNALKACLGMWEDRDWADYASYRQQAWGGRGV